MFIVPGLDLFIAGVFVHGSGIKFDVANTELFRRDKAVFVLLIETVNFAIAHRLFGGKSININRRFTYDTLLRNQRCQLIGFVSQHEIGADHGVDQLLRH